MPKFRYISRFEKLEREEINQPHYTPLTPAAEKGVSPTTPARASIAPSYGRQGAQAERPKAASRAAALAETDRRIAQIERENSRGWTNASVRKSYYDLRIKQDALSSLLNVPSRVNVPPPVKVKPLNSTGQPNTKYGTAGRLSGFTSAAGRPQYHRKSHLVPCIERAARRAVMFALKSAGRAYHVPHRRRPSSGVPC